MDVSPPYCCPRCQGALAESSQGWRCVSCSSNYPLRQGFPDFRTDAAIDVDHDEDLRLAAQLAVREQDTSFSELRAYYYSLRPEASTALHDRHQAHFRAEAIRAARVIQDVGEGPLVDLGCGAGQYLLAAARAGVPAVGIDASLCQLILARRLLADEGFEGHLAAANVERLPFPSETFRSALATDVIEHLDAPELFIAETARVLAPRGVLRLTTPNRFSLTPEPHVGLWGVGWLPHGAAVRYVRARTHVDYSSIRLLSCGLLRGILERAFPNVEIRPAQLADSEQTAFLPMKRALAGAYAELSRPGFLHPALLRITPYFDVMCRK